MASDEVKSIFQKIESTCKKFLRAVSCRRSDVADWTLPRRGSPPLPASARPSYDVGTSSHLRSARPSNDGGTSSLPHSARASHDELPSLRPTFPSSARRDRLLSEDVGCSSGAPTGTPMGFAQYGYGGGHTFGGFAGFTASTGKNLFSCFILLGA